MIKTIKAQVDPAIIGDLPKYFGGWEAALREVFQNAHRAGATTLDITANFSEEVITFLDNGEGCADPEVLLFAKRSTWDTEKVVDAAGLGVFSLLNPEIVEQVFLASRDWHVPLVPQAVAQGESFEVTPCDYLEGFLLDITLVKPQREKLLDTLKKVRELFPFVVTFNDDTVIEAEKFAAALVVETPAGKAYWRESNAYEATRFEAAWEYRRIYSESFRKALRDAADQHPQAKLARALYECGSLRWFINPECGVRPKLPDRSDLIAGETLQAAARMIVNALTEKALAQFKAITAKWPDRLPTRNYSHNNGVWSEVSAALRVLSAAAVQCLGWRECKADDMTTGRAWDEDGICVEYDDRLIVYDKNALVTDDAWLAETINNLLDARGIEQRSLATLKKDDKTRPALEAAFKALAPFNVVAYFDEHADSDLVEIEGLRVKHAPKEKYKSPDPFIALAERITFKGVELPFLLGDTGNEDQPVLIIVGSAEDAVRLLKSDDPGGRLLWHCVMAQAQRSSLWDDDWAIANDQVNEAQVLKDLVLEVTENFGDKKTLKARQTHAQLSEIYSQLNAASLRIPFKCKSGDAAVTQALKRARKEIALAEKLTRKAMTRVAKAV